MAASRAVEAGERRMGDARMRARNGDDAPTIRDDANA